MDPVSPPLTGVAADVGRFVLVPHSVFPDVEIGPAYPGHGWVARHVRGGLAQGAVAPRPRCLVASSHSHTCGTMSFIMKRYLIVKSSLLIMSPF